MYIASPEADRVERMLSTDAHFMVVGSGDVEGAFLKIAALCPDVALVDQVLTRLDCACAPGLVQGKKLYPLLAQRFDTAPGAWKRRSAAYRVSAPAVSAC